MSTALSVKLVYGAATLDLNSAPYEIAEGFTPPAALVQPTLAAGTSANRFGGSTLVGRRATDRGFSFGLHLGPGAGSAALIEGALRRLQFMLDQAGNPDTPLYLVYRSTTDTTLTPLWGQAALYYEITTGMAALTSIYSMSDMRARALPNCAVTLTLKPYAVGVAQLVATATGGILPDQWGTPDGNERGLIIPGATPTGGNKMTNPVFGNATWNSGWSTGTNIVASQNTNVNYLLPQTQSSALVQSFAATLNTYTQSINVGGTGNHVISALVMRPDGAAVTSADCDLFYGAAQTTAYQNLGDGLYLLTCSMAGVNAGTATGLRIKSGMSVYLLAIQIELGSAVSQICWGDLLGCAWTGTAHASTSTRTAGQVFVPIDDTVLRAAQGTLAFTWVAPIASSAYAASAWLFFDARNGSFKGPMAEWDGSGGDLALTDGTNTVTFATSFNAGDVLVFHCVYGPAGMTLYRNGVSVATTATFTPATLGANLYLGGARNALTNNPGGTFVDFRTFGYPLSAAEVLADYTNTSKVSGATVDVCQRVGAIPWRYTVGGDNIVTGVYGLVNSVQKYNYCAFGGIPGSAAAKTELKLTHSVQEVGFGAVHLARLKLPFFFSPASLLYSDQSGTADVGASSGDAYNTTSITNSPVVDYGPITLTSLAYGLLQGLEFYIFTRLKDAGSNLTIGIFFRPGTTTQPVTYAAIRASSSFTLYKTPPIIFPRIKNVFLSNVPPSVAVYLEAVRSVAGAANVGVDFFELTPRPLTVLFFPSANSNGTIIHVSGTSLRLELSGTFDDTGVVNGDIFELDPGVYNVVIHHLLAINDINNYTFDVTATLTHNIAYVTPRYALL